MNQLIMEEKDKEIDKNQHKDKNDNYQKKQSGNKKSGHSLWWIYALIFIPIIVMYMLNDSKTVEEIPSYTEFQQLVEKDFFDVIVVFKKKNVIEATVKREHYHEVFKNEGTKAGEAGARVSVQIPSVEIFTEFFDKTRAENDLSAEAKYKEGDDFFGVCSFQSVLLF